MKIILPTLRIVFCVGFILLCALPISSLDILNTIIKDRRQLSALLPVFQEGHGEMLIMNGKIRSPLYYSAIKDPESGNFQVIIQSSGMHFKITTDKYINIIESITIYSSDYDDYIKKLGFDTLKYSQDNSKQTIDFNYFRQNNIVKHTAIQIDENTMSSDLLLIYLECLLLVGSRENFICDVISSQKGMKIRMDIKFIESDNLQKLSPSVTFPDKFNEITAHKNYYVYQLSIEGLIGFFIRTKWYVAFEPNTPYIFFSYWGGENDDLEIVYLTDHKFQINDKIISK